jgi:hypothetical protein
MKAGPKSRAGKEGIRKKGKGKGKGREGEKYTPPVFSNTP